MTPAAYTHGIRANVSSSTAGTRHLTSKRDTGGKREGSPATTSLRQVMLTPARAYIVGRPEGRGNLLILSERTITIIAFTASSTALVRSSWRLQALEPPS